MSDYIDLKGKFKWANKLTNPEPALKPEDPPKWSIVFYPDADALELIRELQGQGLKNVLKKDEDGYYVKFGRPIWRKIKGKQVDMNPVSVTGALSEQIGNGTEGVIKLEVYQHSTPSGGKAKAARLFAIKVDKLVDRPAYVSDGGAEPKQEDLWS